MNLLTKENLILCSTIMILFVLFFLGWLINGGTYVWGTYSEVDGQLAAWISRALITWAKPFDINSLNPFQGMGSTFIPWNAWFNPGALALSLPFNQLITYPLSYSIYWIELFVVMYFFGKTVGLRKVEAIIAAEVLVLVLFPPFAAYFRPLPFFSLAPMNAHWEALIMLATLAFLKLGNVQKQNNLWLISFLLISSFLIILASGFTFYTYIPVYGIIILGLIAPHLSRKKLLWKGGTLFLLLSIFFLLHANHYYQNTSSYVSAVVPVTKITSLSASHAPLKFDFCDSQTGFCAQNAISIFHLIALLGGLAGLFWRQGQYRWFALGFLIAALFPHFMFFLIENNILTGPISKIYPVFYTWAAYPFYCIFFAIFWSFICACTEKLIIKYSVSLTEKYKNPAQILRITMAYIIIPLAAFFVFMHYVANAPKRFEGPAKTPIVAYLQNNIGLTPGAPFQGSAASYFASQDSPTRAIFGVSNAKETRGLPDHYIREREYWRAQDNNRYMFTDLWNFNIPTLEEYGQWITLPMFVFFQKMLASDGDEFDRHFLNIYKLNLKVVSALGVRFIITDKRLNDESLHLVGIQKHKNALSKEIDSSKNTPPLYLYEIKTPNLATYSPIHVIRATTANEMFAHMERPDFLFDKSVVVNEDLPSTIVNQLNDVQHSEMRFKKNAVSVSGKSKGWAMLLLPLQYSHCYTLINKNKSSTDVPRLIRANLVQGALLFKNKLDVVLRFNYGIGRNASCKRDDIMDMQRIHLQS